MVAVFYVSNQTTTTEKAAGEGRPGGAACGD